MLTNKIFNASALEEIPSAIAQQLLCGCTSPVVRMHNS